MSELKAPKQKEFIHVSISELVAYAAEQHLKDDVGGDFNEVEGRIFWFIEGAATLLTPKHVLAQVSFPLKRRDSK